MDPSFLLLAVLSAHQDKVLEADDDDAPVALRHEGGTVGAVAVRVGVTQARPEPQPRVTRILDI